MRKLLTILLFFVLQVSLAQNSVNTKNYHQSFKELIFKNPDSALYYIKKLKLEKDVTNSFFSSYYYHQNLGQYYFFTAKLDSSEWHYKKAYDISILKGIDSLIIDSNIWLANHEYFKGESKNSILRYENILEHSKKANYLEGIASAYSRFAGVEPDLSKKMNLYLKIDSLYTNNNTQSSLLARVKGYIAEIYLDAKGNNDLAKNYIEQCITISKEVDYPPGEYEANRLLIKLAVQENNFNEAIQLYKHLLNQSNKIGDPTAISVSTIGLAKMYFKKKEFDKTEKYLTNVGYLIEKPEASTFAGIVHLHWVELFIALNEPKKALFHLEKARMYPDVTDLLGFKTELNRVEINYYDLVSDYANAYQTKLAYDEQVKYLNQQENANGFILNQQLRFKEQQLQEVALLKAQYELTDTLQKAQRNFLFGIIAFTSLIALLIFILYRNRIKVNHKLKEVDALKTEFFTNISHEFRTPLTLISAPIQEALTNAKLSNDQRKHLEIAQKSTVRLSSLVDQLLELSKIDSGNRKLRVQQGYATQLIAAWSESFSFLALQKNIDFNLQISDTDKLCWFDQNAVENIVINLLGNAIKYTPEQGSILLSSKIVQNNLKITIKNTGNGISTIQMKTIFNRFYQTSDHNEGVGIGLSLVKELTELHGGKINVSSDKLNYTLFDVSLCIDKKKLKNIEVIKSIEPRHSKITTTTASTTSQEEISPKNDLPILLIVEDNKDVRTLLQNTFKNMYSIIQASDGEEGIQIALNKIPDIIISDLMMPKKDGLELTKTLKNDERTSHIPIILLTAKAGDDHELTGIEFGSDDYITKPFNQKILERKTASLVALRKKLQSRYSQEIILRPKEIAISSVDEKFLNKLQKILDNNLIDPAFNAADFSTAIHMSRMQLHRKLKALTGLATTEFIRSQRLKLATQMLKKPGINVSEVGYSVGFNNHAYFSKCFKEVYHCTPSEYISSHNTKIQ
ncbi:response regulator [Maribacter sp. 1_2014MBL_MicDiv]|uniref:response regulator n=1 Tax=Maribacter sp. 1_2014MBL_MicDiv TaxID=1644130 RepID=UPI0009F2DEAA|nr:response regulator [Maribacter sp. 1_2014MBL_MicDiv]